jgi:hypothetical protein
MIKRLSSVLLTAIALGSPVAANELKDYIYSNPVLAEVHRSGTTIRFKDPSCDRGIFGSYTRSTDVMVLCLANHPDFAELGDTIRHETVHIIQACNGGPVMSFESIAKYAQASDYKAMHNYGTHSHHHEIEANLAARTLSDEQVVTSFKNACYEN